MSMTPFNSIADVMRANRALGHHFFDAPTMRFFSSRIGQTVWPLADGSALFVTSEQAGQDSPRRYTIRIAQPSGEVHSWSEFQEYGSLNGAKGAAARIAAHYNTNG